MNILHSIRWRAKYMLKRKLQDLTVCCAYQINFLHQKAHSSKEFRRQYRLHDEIGRGGFGVVYEGVRASDGLPVAVKFVEHKHVREWTMTCNQLIPSELCHLQTCDDIPGCVKLIDWFASSKGFLMVMERPMDCVDVFDLVSTYGKLDEPTARAIFIQVIDTVCAMHAKHGLIHRDIKDENLIINMETGEVKLVDFGATAPAAKAYKKEFQGTRSYCPPEWFRQLQYLPMEATSWSLGVLLYILVCGNLPFRNEVQICLGRLSFPPHVSKDCVNLIRKCLTGHIAARASIVEIRQHAWMQMEVPDYSHDNFREVLERTHKRRLGDERSPRRRGDEATAAEEEERLLNERVAMEERSRVERRIREVEEGRDDKEDHTSYIHPCPDKSLADTATSVSEYDVSAWMTGEEEREGDIMLEKEKGERGGSVPLNAHYENVSVSSLADYMSVANLSVASADTRADTISMATTNNIYYSVGEIFDEDDEDCSSAVYDLPVVKSASAYNLAKPRKRSLMRSFDELGTVHEQQHEEPSCDSGFSPSAAMTSSVTSPAMTASMTSTTSTLGDDTTVIDTTTMEEEGRGRKLLPRPHLLTAPPPLAVYRVATMT